MKIQIHSPKVFALDLVKWINTIKMCGICVQIDVYQKLVHVPFPKLAPSNGGEWNPPSNPTYAGLNNKALSWWASKIEIQTKVKIKNLKGSSCDWKEIDYCQPITTCISQKFR